MEKAKIKKNTKTKEEISLSAKIYNSKGEESGSINLEENIFGLPWNADLVHQVVTSMESSQRGDVAHTKNRGEVSGGGKKPWKQKGTGRARHGSTRSPIWRHGGVTHGPRNEKDYSRKVNKKMKAKALYTILSAKYRSGQIIFVDNLTQKSPKTKEALNTLKSLSGIESCKDLLKKRKNSIYIGLSSKDATTEKSFRNFSNLMIDEIRNINPVWLMKYKYLLISNPEKGIEQISSKLKLIK